MELKKEVGSLFKKAKEISTRVALEVVQTFEADEMERKLQKNLGCQYAETGDYEKAIECQKQAYDIAQEQGDTEKKINPCRELGESFFKIGDYEKSISYCNEYLEIAPGYRTEEACVTKILGLSHHNLGQYDEAIPPLERCLELSEGWGDDKEIAEANGNLGITYRELGEYEKAKEKLNKCIQISEKWEYQSLKQQMLVELGRVYEAMNQHTSAAKYFQYSLPLAEKLQDNEKIANVYRHLAEACLSQNQPQDAIDYLKKAYTKSGKLTTVLAHAKRLGDAYLMNKEPQEAMKWFEEYLTVATEEDSSEKANVTINMGKSYAERGEYGTAIEYYLKGLEMIEPLEDKKSEGEAHKGLADAYYKTKQYSDAERHYKEALEIANAQNDKNLKGRVDIKLGDVFLIHENTQEAFPYYYEALMIAESGGNNEMKADAYEGLGNSTSDYDDAIENHNKNLKLAIELDDMKRQQRAHENLGNAYFTLKKWSKASESYERCCAIAKDNEDTAAVCRCERKMGNANFESEEYYDAIYHHKSCLETATQMNDNSGKAESYRIIGCSYSKINQPQNALEFYDKFLDMVDTTMDSFKVAAVYLDAGKLCTECGDHEKAICLYHKYLNLVKDSEDLGNLKLKQETLEKLGDAYYENSQYDVAYEYYFKIDQLSITEPNRRCQIYYKLGKTEFSRKNIPVAIRLYYTALDLVQNVEIEADICEALGDAFYLNEDYENAIKYHSQNLEFPIPINSKKTPDDQKRRQRVYESLGDVYSTTKQWLLAIEKYGHSCEAGKKLADKERLAQCERKLGNAYYQVKDYDKAIKFLKNANETSQLLEETYDIIGRAYAKMEDYENAVHFLSKDLTIATELHDLLRQARAQGNIGQVYVKTRKFQDAIECQQKALKLVQQLDDKEAEADVYCNLGCAYQASGQYDEAMEKQETSLQLAKNLKNKSQQGRAHKKMGNIHFAKGEHEKAIHCYYACLEIAEDTEKSTKLRVLGKLSCMWSSIGQHDMMITCLKRQAENAENFNDKARAFEKIGIHFEQNGDYVQALEYQEKYLEVAKEMDDEHEQGQAYVNIANIHLAKGKYEEAIGKSKTAERLGNTAVKATAYSVMGSAYTGLGQYKIAEDLHRKEMDIIEFDDRSGIAQANGNIGMALFGTGDYEKAVAHFRKQMGLAKEVRDKREEGRANENFGNYHAAIGECNEAMSYYNKSLEIAKEVNDKAGIGRLNGCIGTIYTEIGQYQNAVEWHKEERKIAEDLGNKVREGQALGNLGNAYTGLCEYQKAIDLHEDSLKIAKENVVQADQRRANGNLGNTYMASGKYREALNFQGKALKISQQLGHRAAEGRILESMARAYYLSGQIEKAVESCRKSLHIARQVGDNAGEGRTLGTLGKAYIEFGQKTQRAISHIRDYLKISKEHSNEADKGDALGSMAVVLIELGQYNKAFECCNESLKIAKNLHDKARMGRAYENLGKFYTAVGQYEKAIENHCNHLKIAEKLCDRAEVGRANGNLGNAYNKNGLHKEAMKCHTLDKDIAEEFNNEAQMGRAQGNMGNTYTNMRQFETGFNCHLKRLGIAEELNDRPSLAKALQGLGVHYINTDQCEKAIQYLERLEKISRPAHPDSHESAAHLDSLELTAIAQELLGKCYQKNDVSKACSYFAKSIVNFQALRHSVRDYDEFNISMSNRFARVHKLLLQSLLNLEEVKTALLVSDCGKAQALHDLTRKIAHSDLSLPTPWSSDSDPMETIADNPSSSTSKNLFNDKLKNVINSNQADTIISYAFGENGELHSWVFSQGRVFYKSLKIINEPSLRSYINRQIGHLYKKLDVESTHVDAMKNDVKAAQDFEARACNPLWLMSDDIGTCSPLEEHDLLTTSRKRGPSTNSSAQQTAQNCYLQDLYNALIQPIEEHLTGSKLLIVPEGPLFTLPFAALLDPSGSHLCDKYSLQFIPSLLVLDSCLLTRPPPELGQALFVGNPKIDILSTLQFAEKEAIDCSKIFNAQPLVLHMATKKNVLNGMKTASIIHIAAHGNMNRAEIFLTPNEGEPLSPSSYLLTAGDIQKCTLNARLVVLSCCYSGCGKISSEGVVGTARSFLGSGARAVLVALWPINDEATMELVIELYKKLTQEYSLCAALQQAMMVLKRRYLSPKVWAPFQIFGEDIVLTKQEIEKIRLVSASR